MVVNMFVFTGRLRSAPSLEQLARARLSRHPRSGAEGVVFAGQSRFLRLDGLPFDGAAFDVGELARSAGTVGQ